MPAPSFGSRSEKGAVYMNLILNLGLCGVLILIIVAVALYRKWLEDHGDHYIHLHNDSIDSRVITTQTSMAKRIETLEKLTRYLIVAAIVYGIAIAGAALYSAWNNTGT